MSVLRFHRCPSGPVSPQLFIPVALSDLRFLCRLLRICVGPRRNANRFVYILLVPVCLLFGGNTMEWLLLVPPMVYTLLLIVRDQWDMEYFHFTASFRQILIIFGITVVVVHFGVLIENRSDFTRVLDSAKLLRHYLMYAFCGILLQRQLRLGADTGSNRYLNTLQLILLTGGTGATVLSIALAERYLSNRGLSLGQLLGGVFKYLLGIPLALMNYLFILLSELQSEKMDQFKQEHYSDIEAVPKMPLEEMQQLLPQTTEEPAAFPWWLAVLLLVSFTCILILLLRNLGTHHKDPVKNETISTIQPKAKEKLPPRGSNRSKIRKIYRDFLKAEKRMGHKLFTYHTSRNILDALVSRNRPEAAELRRIYLTARYDMNSEISSEDVQAAREALKKYRKE